jgi:hypothetical protein
VTKSAGWVLALAGLAAVVAGYFALLFPSTADKVTGGASAAQPVWTEVKWPFPIDQWGTGRAFACKAANCGSELRLYLRAKLGSCNCTTGIAEDADRSHERLRPRRRRGVAAGCRPPDRRRLDEGPQPRLCALTARNPPGKSALSVAFNDRCDMVVATAVLPHDRPATIEPGVMAFLNSRPLLRWVEIALGI